MLICARCRLCAGVKMPANIEKGRERTAAGARMLSSRLELGRGAEDVGAQVVAGDVRACCFASHFQRQTKFRAYAAVSPVANYLRSHRYGPGCGNSTAKVSNQLIECFHAVHLTPRETTCQHHVKHSVNNVFIFAS